MILSRRDSLGKGNPPLLGLGILGDITGCSSKPDEKHVGKGGRILRGVLYYGEENEEEGLGIFFCFILWGINSWFLIP